jgi:hypothetical protein
VHVLLDEKLLSYLSQSGVAGHDATRVAVGRQAEINVHLEGTACGFGHCDCMMTRHNASSIYHVG